MIKIDILETIAILIIIAHALVWASVMYYIIASHIQYGKLRKTQAEQDSKIEKYYADDISIEDIADAVVIRYTNTDDKDLTDKARKLKYSLLNAIEDINDELDEKEYEKEMERVKKKIDREDFKLINVGSIDKDIAEAANKHFWELL